MYYTKGDIQQAKKYVDAAIAADPQNANAQQLKQHLSLQDSNEVMNQAVTYMNQGEYANAKKLMEKLSLQTPTISKHITIWVTLLMRQKNMKNQQETL